MRTSELDEDYDTVVAVHGFNPLAPQDPDTKDFRPVAQDRIKEAYEEVRRQQEDEIEGLKVRPVASSESYAAPQTDEKGNITEENPGPFIVERGNKLRPAIEALDEDEGIWSLFGDSRDKISEKTSEIRDILNR